MSEKVDLIINLKSLVHGIKVFSLEKNFKEKSRYQKSHFKT
jgi:hypothetical protein